jgi:hypothetical protein
MEADKAVAVAHLRYVYDSRWWDNAGYEEIANTFTLAYAWAGQSEQAKQAQDRMKDELRARHNLDVNELDEKDPDALKNALGERFDAAQKQADANKETQEAATLTAAANVVDQAATTEEAASDHGASEDSERDRPEFDYDTAERRQQFADDLIASGVDPEIAQGRVLADAGRAEPVSSSIGRARRRGPRASKASASRIAAVQRSEPQR